MNQKVKNNKDKDNSSNSLVFGQWPQTKSPSHDTNPACLDKMPSLYILQHQPRHQRYFNGDIINGFFGKLWAAKNKMADKNRWSKKNFLIVPEISKLNKE